MAWRDGTSAGPPQFVARPPDHAEVGERTLVCLLGNRVRIGSVDVEWEPEREVSVLDVNPAGTHLRKIAADAWVEYPSFSPDGTHLVFMGHVGSDYDIYVVEIESGRTTQLTDSPGADGWPVWSPDGSAIAFTTERDDCARTGPGEACWKTGEPGEHHDIWVMAVDGSNPRRVTPEFGQFVAWSPGGQYLLISGQTLFVVRPDGNGRIELRSPGSAVPLGGIPDWTP